MTDTELIPADDADFESIGALLTKIEIEDNYYVIPGPEEPLLRRLAAAAFIRWCPYPEEFYVLQPDGKRQLQYYREVRGQQES